MSLKIGDVIWIRSTEWEGSQFNTKEIAGETSRSWLLQSPNPDDWTRGIPRYMTKLPKNLKGFVLGTEQDFKKRHWATDNRHQICKIIDRLYDADKLITIANILGYDVPEDINGKTKSSKSPAVEVADGH